MATGTEQYDVFISYSHTESDWVERRLVPGLESSKLRVALDTRDFEIGQYSLINMTKFVDNSRHVIIVLTPEWVNSQWGQYEGILASGNDPAARRLKTLPIMLRDCVPPEHIRALTFADFRAEANYEQQMLRLVRAIGGSAEFLPVAPAFSAAPAPPISGRPVAEGLQALTSLTEYPKVKEAALLFRTIFQSASEEITRVADYKALHDQLHDLQFKCFDVMSANAQGFAQNPEVKLDLEGVRIDFETLVAGLEEAAGKFDRFDISWISLIKDALDEFTRALQNKDSKLFRQVLRRLDHELTLRPPQINARLNQSARALKLGNLVDALKTICNSASTQQANVDRLSQFESGIDALNSMDTRLSALVRLHDQWQELDIELRVMDKNQDLESLSYAWEGFRPKAEEICSSLSGPFLASFKSSCANFESALSRGIAAEIQRHFRLIRRQVGLRFYATDSDLKNQCNQLRIICEPLTSVLRVIG